MDLPKTLDSDTANRLETALIALDGEVVHHSEFGDVDLFDEVRYRDDAGRTIAGIAFSGSIEEYEALATPNWSPSTVVYDTMAANGFDRPTDDPTVGVKFDRVNDRVVIETVVSE